MAKDVNIYIKINIKYQYKTAEKQEATHKTQIHKHNNYFY